MLKSSYHKILRNSYYDSLSWFQFQVSISTPVFQLSSSFKFKFILNQFQLSNCSFSKYFSILTRFQLIVIKIYVCFLFYLSKVSCATEDESCKDKYCCNGFLCNGEVCKKGIESVFEYRTSFIIIIEC